MQNPLLQPFEFAPFDQIQPEHFAPAIKELIAATHKEINAITSQRALATFLNTVVALERTGEQLNKVSGIFFNLNSAETNDQIQAIAQEISPLLSEFKNDLLLNADLFARVKLVYQNKDQLELTPEDAMLLEKQYQGFARNGANLNAGDQEKLRSLDAQLSKLTLLFGQNVLAETNSFSMHLTQEEEVAGLPENALQMAAQLANEQDKEGWVFTLDYPSYIPFMKYAQNRELRKKMALAFGAKAFNANAQDNQQNVLKIAQLRHNRAQLLGYNSHAHFVLEDRMAKTPAAVTDFLNDLLVKAKPAAQKEFKRLEEFAQQLDGLPSLEKWDSAYYAEKLKQKLYDLDDQALKPYFELDNVIQGAFTVAQRLFDLHFESIETIAVYHQDVKTYRVTNSSGEKIAFLYADFHPRAGKRGGAWMTSYKSQQIKDGLNERPHISIVCNFSPPTTDAPSLLTFNEVTTLFHEFGHALHGMLANTTYSSLSGTSVLWDFVELPSQLMENWCYQEEALALFAKHYKTGAAIPMELVAKIREAATFNEGMQTLRQISFGLLDMSWHGADPSGITSVKEHEQNAFAATQLFPDTPQTCMSTSFSHIFQGGYSAGYYSYKWAEVLDADAFSYFKEAGIFNPEVASRFKDFVLSQGGTIDPMELYIKFRGKKPDPNALLERAGLL